MYDSEMVIDQNSLLQKRIFELEAIINEYKHTSDDISEIKISDSFIYRLNDVSKKSIEVQVNLTGQIYENYE